MRIFYSVNNDVFNDVGEGKTRLQGRWDALVLKPLCLGIALGVHKDCLVGSVRHESCADSVDLPLQLAFGRCFPGEEKAEFLGEVEVSNPLVPIVHHLSC